MFCHTAIPSAVLGRILWRYHGSKMHTHRDTLQAWRCAFQTSLQEAVLALHWIVRLHSCPTDKTPSKILPLFVHFQSLLLSFFRGVIINTTPHLHQHTYTHFALNEVGQERLNVQTIRLGEYVVLPWQ